MMNWFKDWRRLTGGGTQTHGDAHETHEIKTGEKGVGVGVGGEVWLPPMGFHPPRRDLGLLIIFLVVTIVVTFVVAGGLLIFMLGDPPTSSPNLRREFGADAGAGRAHSDGGGEGDSHQRRGLTSKEGGRGSRANPLLISVYYETLCPDSKRFITTQLHPLFNRLGGLTNPYFDIDYVPYGKANTTAVGDGSYSFVCQHGPRECEGNRVHACALAHLPPATHSSFIACTMSSSDPPSAGPACGWLYGLDLARVNECYENPLEGTALLAAHGERTHALEPTLYYVPWITHNGRWTVEDLDNSQTNLLGVVCAKLAELGAARPPDC